MVCALCRCQCLMPLLQGNNTAATHLVQAALSECQPPSPSLSQSGASKRRAKQQPPGKAQQIAAHPLVHARALHLQAKLMDSSTSSPDADHVVLTGCDSGIAQRQRSHAEASTSAAEQPKPETELQLWRRVVNSLTRGLVMQPV